jgi:hypothetical protein
MVCQENTYAYGAVSIADGRWDSLILPKANTVCMQIFLDESGHIGKFIENYNQTAKPFVWKKREVKGAQLANNVRNFCN